jgi:hypothetical protein
MQILQWELFAPDFEDNRARAAKGEPAVLLQIRPPSARIWSRFWLAMSTAPREVPEHLQSLTDKDEGAQAGLVLYLATLDEQMASILFLGCVGEVTWPEFLTPGFSPKTGAELWEARDRIPSFKLYQSTLEALINRARLDEGLVRFLASEPGRQALDREVNTKDGTVKSVESVAST